MKQTFSGEIVSVAASSSAGISVWFDLASMCTAYISDATLPLGYWSIWPLMSGPCRRIFEKDQFRPFCRAQRNFRRERRHFPSVFDRDQNATSAHVIGCKQVMRRQDWRSTAVKRRWDADLTYAMNQSTEEAWRRDPQPSFRAPQRRLQGGGQPARVPRFSGSFLPHKKCSGPGGLC